MRTQKTFRRKARVNANIRLVYSISRGGVVTIFLFCAFFLLFFILNKSQTGEMEPMESFFFCSDTHLLE